MTMTTTLLNIAILAAVAVGLPWVLGRLLAAVSHRATATQDTIDDLIEQNRARWCREGTGYMDRPDWGKVRRLGAQRWEDTVRAQHRGMLTDATARPLLDDHENRPTVN